MSSIIVGNITSRETRVALLENRIITELFIERKAEQGLAGNIYKGKVSKVLPGMQVAFIDIGLEKAGFLYVSDIDHKRKNGGFSAYLDSSENGDELTADDSLIGAVAEVQQRAPIETLLKEGQEIMVQVSKDPMGSKGARVTNHISLPGRYLVLMPNINQVGVSRRIESEQEKNRLKDALLQIKENGSGYIIRTAAEGKDLAELTKDVEFLGKLWGSINRRCQSVPAPGIVYHELNIIERSVRDLFTHDVSEMIIDSRKEYEKAISFCEFYIPGFTSKISLYTGKAPVFDKYGIEIDIERALGRKVWLKSGGYIIIDQTEALTAIDVNTGKYVGKRNQEETILKTNLEAVQEIVYQVRLRNIGGLIIIDFIDMERQESKDKTYNTLEQALKSDRSRTNILKISDLGLVEMTRKRSRNSLSRIQTASCPYCEGKGRVKSSATVLYEVYREIRRVAGEAGKGGELICSVAPGVAEMMFEEESVYLEALEKELGVKVTINTDFKQHQERFSVESA